MGFTLLEILVVIIIATSIFAIMFIQINHFKITNEIKRELELLGLIVEKYQSDALVNDSEYIIKLNQNLKVIENNNVIFKHKINPQIIINSNFNNQQITINERGHLNRAGTVEYKRENIKHKIIFSISKGRYRIE